MIFFFLQCKESEKKKELPDTYSLDKLLTEVRRFDPQSAMLKFKTDSAAFTFHGDILRPFNPPVAPHMKGKIAKLVWIELEPSPDGKHTEDFTTEYLMTDGRLNQIISTDTANNTVKTIKYGLTNLPVRFSIYFPQTNDSTTHIYHYSLDKRLTRIESFDGKNQLYQTRYLKYHSNGNLSSVFSDFTTKADHVDNIFLNNTESGSIIVRTDTKWKLQWAVYTTRDSIGNPVYQENFDIDQYGTSLMSKRFSFDEHNDVKQMDVLYKPQQVKEGYTFTFPKRDSTGNWLERLTYRDGELVGITRCVITYQ